MSIFIVIRSEKLGAEVLLPEAGWRGGWGNIR